MHRVLRHVPPPASSLLPHREEVIEQAKRQREQRAHARSQGKAALVIQAAWRGRCSRRAARAAHLQRWRQEFSQLSARPDAAVTAQQLAQAAVPLLLGLLLPAGTPATRRCLAQGAPLQLDAGGREALKGTLGLLLRSLSSSSPEHNYCALAAASTPQWVCQCTRLLQLCAASSAAQPAGQAAADDGLLEAAAARVMMLLLQPDAWKAGLAGGQQLGRAAARPPGQCSRRPQRGVLLPGHCALCLDARRRCSWIAAGSG